MNNANLSASSFALKPLAAAAILFCTPSIQALPTIHGDLPAGVSVEVDAAAGTTTVNQLVERALANWQDFSILAGETVRFVQPSDQSVILNRVVGENASEIFGVLQANGRVFLINPNGIVFGAGSEVSAGSLVASTLDLGEGMRGDESTFVLKLGEVNANIVHDGQIDASQIALIAAQVKTGAASRLGKVEGNSTVHLISAREVTANLSPDQIAFAVEKGFERAVIEKLGQVNTVGGQVFLIAQSEGAQDRPSVINLAGVLQAREIVVTGDTIQLSGVVDAAQSDGQITMMAKTVSQNAGADVSGASSFQAEQIDLTHADNKLKGDLQLTASRVSLNTTTDLTLHGNVGALEANSASALIFGETTASSVTATAAQIGQTGAIAVVGQSTLSTTSTDSELAQSIALDQVNNDFVGELVINSNGKAVSLADRNDLIVQANTGDLAVKAQGNLSVQGSTGNLNATAGNTLTFGETTAANVTATAVQIAQTGAIAVTGQSTLTATSTDPALSQSIALDQVNNDFVGEVVINSNGKAVSLVDQNDLSIQANTGNLTATAQGNLSVQGNTGNLNATAGNTLAFGETTAATLNATAAQIAQTGAIAVTGQSTLTATSTDPALSQSIALDQVNNDFVGEVVINSNGKAVSLADQNDLSIQANTGNLTATAQGNLSVQGNTGNLNATAGNTLTFGETTAATLNATAAQITQTGAMTVAGRSNLTTTNTDPALAQSIELDQANNDFVGEVVINSNGKAVSLADQNDLSIQANTGNLTATAQGNLSVQGNTNRLIAAADNMLLNTASENVTARAQNNLIANGTFGDLNATAGNTLTFGDTTASSVTATAGQIAQNGAIAVTGQSTLTATSTDPALAQSIALNHANNDFVGELVINSNGKAVSLADQNDLSIQANTGNLTATAQGNLSVQGNTNVLIAAADNMLLNTASANVNARAQNNLIANGTFGDLNATAGNTLTFGDTTASSVTATAGQIAQNGAIAVTGQSTLTATSTDPALSQSIALNQANNDFVGEVIINSNGKAVSLVDQNDLSIQANTGNLTATAQGNLSVQGSTGNLNATAGNTLTFGETTAATLNATAAQIAQTGAIAVAGQSTLSTTSTDPALAQSIALNQANNDFVGEVVINSNGKAVSLVDRSDLSVQAAASVSTLDATAGGVLNFGEITAATLNATAAQITQTGAMTVAGRSTLSTTSTDPALAQSIALDQVNNDFVGEVVINSNGKAVSLADRNDLIVQANTGDLAVKAQGNLNVQGGTGVFSANVGGSLSLGEVNTNGVNATAGRIVQTGVLRATGDSSLTSTDTNLLSGIQLTNEANDFTGNVHLNSNGTLVNLRDRDNLTLSAQTGVLNIVANGELRLGEMNVAGLNATVGSVQQVGAVTVTGSTSLNTTDISQSGNIVLNRADNDFMGDLFINSNGQGVELSDQNTLKVQGNMGDLSILTGGGLTFGQTTAKSLQVDALTVGQTSEIAVGGTSSIRANGRDVPFNIDLSNANNNFSGAVILDSNGQPVTIRDRNDLIVGTLAGSALTALNVNVGGQVTFTQLEADHLNVNARSMAQSAGIVVNSTTNLQGQGGAIVLDHSNNDFKTEVLVNNSGDVVLNDQNTLAVRGQLGSAKLTALDQLVLGSIQADALNARGASVSQTAAISVAGESVIQATNDGLNNNINLDRLDNNFSGRVFLESNAENVNLRAGNDLIVGSRVQGLTVSAGNTLTLNEVATRSLQAHANLVNQTGRVFVQEDATIQANQLNLQHQDNDFEGAVNLQVTESATIRDRNNLDVNSSAPVLNATAGATLTLRDLTLTNLNATGAQIAQTGALIVTGEASLTTASGDPDAMQSIRLDQADNDFVGRVTVNSTGNMVALNDQNDLSIQANTSRLAVSAQDSIHVQGVVGNLNATAGHTLTFGETIAASVNASAALIAQTGAITVNGESTFITTSADPGLMQSIQLDRANNDFVGNVKVNSNDKAASLVDRNDLNLLATASSLNVAAGGKLTFGEITVAELNATAGQIAQTGAITVMGESTLTNTSNDSALAQSIQLDQGNNDFMGNVRVNSRGNGVALNDQNDLNIQANTTSLTATAQGNLHVQGDAGDLNATAVNTLTFGETSARSVSATAAQITQTGAIIVAGQSTLTATSIDPDVVQSIDLNHGNNDFTGEVAVNGNGKAASLVDRGNLSIRADAGALSATAQGNLSVRGKATDLNVTAGNMLTFGEIVAGTVNATAAQVAQTAAVTVAGQTTLTITSADPMLVKSIQLDQANNDFVGNVTIDSNGKAVTLVDQNDLDIQASAGSLTATAQGNLNVQGVATELNAIAGNTVALGQLDVNRLSAKGAIVTQTADLIVPEVIMLEGARIDLQGDNQFAGAVVLNADQAALKAQGALDLQGQVNELQVQAGQLVQTGALEVRGNTHLQADQVSWTHANNDFTGVVKLNVAESTALKDRNSMAVSGFSGNANLSADNTLTLAGLIVQQNLNATADNVDQTMAVTINGPSAFTASTVVLDHADNDFKGPLSLNQTQLVRVSDSNTLTLGDVAGGGHMLLSADTIDQQGAVVHGGRVQITAGQVDLTNAQNDFSGSVAVQASQVAVADADRLVIDIQADSAHLNADDLVLADVRTTGDLRAQARVVTQVKAVQVAGQTHLAAQDVQLNEKANQFSGGVFFNNAGSVQVSSDQVLSLQGQVSELVATAGHITQQEQLNVAASTSLQAQTVNLTHSNNDFEGAVQLNVSGASTIRDSNTLTVTGNVGSGTSLSAQSIQQTKSITAEGVLTLTAQQVALNDANNRLGESLRLNQVQLGNVRAAGTLVLTGQGNGQLNAQAEKVVLGELGTLASLSASASEIGQVAALNVTGDVDLTSPRVNLSHEQNDFAGNVNVLGDGSSQPVLRIRDKNDLALSGRDLTLAAHVDGDLLVNAQNVDLLASEVKGRSDVNLTGRLSQAESIVLNAAQVNANEVNLDVADNRFLGRLQVTSPNTARVITSGSLALGVGDSGTPLELEVGGNATIDGSKVMLDRSVFQGDVSIQAKSIEQLQPLLVKGKAVFNATGGQVVLVHGENLFDGAVSASGESIQLRSANLLQLGDLVVRNAEFTSAGRILLLGNVEQDGGVLSFTANASTRPLSVADLRRVLPPSLDVFSRKEAVNPLTGLGRIEISGPAIEQVSGQIMTSAGSQTHFAVPQSGSVVLSGANRITGSVSALSGRSYQSPFRYDSNAGASLVAINNEDALKVGGQGIEADLVAIRSRGLSTAGESLIRTRMPYNDIAVGAARSYAGLTLSVPVDAPGGVMVTGSNVFGSSASGNGPGQSSSSPGAIRVEVGELSRPGLGGYVHVLPVDGASVLPGQVIYLAGPENQGRYTFFYDGARSLNHIPVVYNGSLLLSPQETAALTSAQGAVVLAQQEQTRSVVRTENVTGKVIHGVVIEAGPGRPATEGQGAAAKPGSCDTGDSGGGCTP